MDPLPIIAAALAAVGILLFVIGIAGLPAGVVILGVGGLAMFTGFMLIRRIVDIEV